MRRSQIAHYPARRQIKPAEESKLRRQQKKILRNRRRALRQSAPYRRAKLAIRQTCPAATNQAPCPALPRRAPQRLFQHPHRKKYYSASAPKPYNFPALFLIRPPRASRLKKIPTKHAQQPIIRTPHFDALNNRRKIGICTRSLRAARRTPAPQYSKIGNPHPPVPSSFALPPLRRNFPSAQHANRPKFAPEFVRISSKIA